MRLLLGYWKNNAVLPLVLAFLALNLIVTQDGGQNAKSRLLAMRSFVEDGNFRLDPFLKVTDDWSRSPDGHYYSNKAPGPMILGLPVFFLADKLHQLVEKGARDERGLRPDPGYFQSTVTSFFMQALPAALLVLAGTVWLSSSGVGMAGQIFFTLAALFANTAALFMNSYFGHGFEALLQLAGILFLLERRFAWSGMMFSFALLSDYGFSVQIPALVLALFFSRPGWKGAGRFVLGALPGAVFWIAYHGLIFGSPFAIASRFQNESFVETGGGRFLLWGVLSFPDPWIFRELLAGPSRGIWIGQPWLLFLGAWILVLGFRKVEKAEFRILSVYCLLGLAGLLFMNASFNGWHGGATAGPRYLSGIFPAFALLGGLSWKYMAGKERLISGLLLGAGVLFRGLVYGGTILAPLVPLWSFYLNELFSRGTPLLRFVIFVLLVTGGIFLSRRRGIPA